MNKTIKMSKNRINYPHLSKYLAEFVGIHYGDGALYMDNRYNYKVYYSFNLSKDLEFSKYFVSLFYKLFHLKLHIYYRPKRNSIELGLRCKELYLFLKDKLKFPVGKKNHLSIPNYIKKKKSYLSLFLRGLFDTDGCVTFQKHKYIIIKICTKDKNFAEEIKSSLDTLEISSCIGKKSSLRNNTLCVAYDIIIRSKNAIIFFKKVGSNNPRNYIIYKKWECRDLNPDLPVSSS